MMNRVCSKGRVLPLLAALLLSGITLFAQSDLGSIQGFVKDPSGATVPGAKVTIHGTGLDRNTQTNETGYYIVTSIPSGLYTITVEASGFKKYESKDNKLDSSAALGD